jgi:hypothetical protein
LAFDKVSDSEDPGCSTLRKAFARRHSLHRLVSQSLLVLIQSVLQLRFQSTELSPLLTKLPVVVGELQDGLSLLGRHPPGDHRALLTPSQARVSMSLTRLGTPAVALPAARIDLVKGPPQEVLMAEDLPEQAAVVGEEGEQLSLEKRA